MFVILVNSGGRVVTVGTKLGRPFSSEAAAERAARKLEKEQPRHQYLVLPIEARP